MVFHLLGSCWRPQSHWDRGFAYAGEPLPALRHEKVSSSSQELPCPDPRCPASWATVAALSLALHSRSFQTVLLQQGKRPGSNPHSNERRLAGRNKDSLFLKPPPNGRSGWPSREYGKGGMTGRREVAHRSHPSPGKISGQEGPATRAQGPRKGIGTRNPDEAPQSSTQRGRALTSLCSTCEQAMG